MSILSAAIKKTLVKAGGKKEGTVFHVGLAGTFDYIPHIGMVILSLSQSNPDICFVFHLFVNALPEKEAQRLGAVAVQTGHTIKIHIVNDEAFSSIIFGKYNASFFYRFIMPDIVKEETDRLLYMDGDMMCRGSIKELAELDLGDYLAAVVPDRNWRRQKKQLGTSQSFFNSGFMLIHVTRWTSEDMFQKVVRMSLDSKKKVDKDGYYEGWHGLRYNDQNILNVMLDGRVIWLPKRYNYIYGLGQSAMFKSRAKNEDYRKQIILHFAGSVKPWHNWVASRPVVKEYQKIWEESPWRDVPPTAPKNKKDCHQAAREYWTTGEYGKSLYWYMEYWKKKL